MGTTNFDALTLAGDLTVGDDLSVTDDVVIGGDLTVTGPIKGASLAIAAATAVYVAEVTYTENGAGTYTGSVALPAGATVLDIVVSGVALWDAATSATMKVGDAGDDDGFFTAVNVKATDLLAGESISLDQAGGKAGAYIANSQVSPRYSASARTISGVITSVGAGTAGRTRMLVVYAAPVATSISAATKA